MLFRSDRFHQRLAEFLHHFQHHTILYLPALQGACQPQLLLPLHRGHHTRIHAFPVKFLFRELLHSLRTSSRTPLQVHRPARQTRLYTWPQAHRDHPCQCRQRLLPEKRPLLLGRHHRQAGQEKAPHHRFFSEDDILGLEVGDSIFTGGEEILIRTIDWYTDKIK